MRIYLCIFTKVYKRLMMKSSLWMLILQVHVVFLRIVLSWVPGQNISLLCSQVICVKKHRRRWSCKVLMEMHSRCLSTIVIQV